MPKVTVSVRNGWDIFLQRYQKKLRGRRIGLLTHAAAVDKKWQPIADRLAALPGLRLSALFGPEHGVRGEAQAGEGVPCRRDPGLGIPVYSLYGRELAEKPGVDLDARMRRYDTCREGKTPIPAMLRGIDILLCDLQDVGCRVYTYAATLAYAMEACGQAGIEVMVLDRPNPVSGAIREGPVLEDHARRSPVAHFPVPLRHGLTLGELAQIANHRLFGGRVILTVVPLSGWRRCMWFDDTRLPWVQPSPNMPSLSTATVYPGQVLFEGTNVSEGRGTTRPFEIVGAPWIDGSRLAAAMNGAGLPGIQFQPTSFVPSFSKYAGQTCFAIQLHVTNRLRYRALTTALHLIRTIMERHSRHFRFHVDYFDQIMGGSETRRMLQAGAKTHDIVDSFSPGLNRFRSFCRPFLLYA